MLGNWNYENYTKAIVPLVLAGGSFLVGWVSNGEFNRVELGNVIWLGIAAILVFLAPNIPIAKDKLVDSDPNLVQGQQAASNAPANVVPEQRVPPQRVQSRAGVQGPLADEPKDEDAASPMGSQPRRRRRTKKDEA